MPVMEGALRRAGEDWARSAWGKARAALLRGPEKLLEGHGQSREKQDPVPTAQSQESGPLGISLRSEHPRPGSVSLGKECPGTT